MKDGLRGQHFPDNDAVIAASFTSVTRSRTVGRTFWTGDQLVARPLTVHKHRKTHTKTQALNIHALSGIRTNGPGVRASEESSPLRALGYRDIKVE
jgi:hypothetical protein